MTASNNHNPKPPTNEQLADILLKLIRTGGIAGGGAGAFWQLFQNSDILKAFASMAIGVGLSYGAKLLMPFHQGNEERAELAGQIIEDFTEHITGQLIAKATGLENKYLLCQASECQAPRTDGMRPYDRVFIPLLRDIFVPLQLHQNSIKAGLNDSIGVSLDQSTDSEALNIWTILSQAEHNPIYRQVAILAWGGYGKSTLLKHVAFRYGTKQVPEGAPQLIPFLLVLREYRDLLCHEKSPDLPTLIVHHHMKNLPGSDVLNPSFNWVLTVLRSGRALVMLDGFDEVDKKQRPVLAKWITQQMRRYEKSRFLLTSRPNAYKYQDSTSRVVMNTLLWVLKFNADQRNLFVTSWYESQEKHANMMRKDAPDVKKAAYKASQELLEQIEAQPSLRDLARNPLLLNMIATFHRSVPGAKLPERKVDLYQDICNLQLTTRPRSRGVAKIITQCGAEDILQEIAFAMMKRRQPTRISKNLLLDGLAKILKRKQERFEAKDFLAEIVQVSELLVQQEDEYEFAHFSFQEYLAAKYISRTKQESFLYGYLHDDKWRPTILLYAAQVNPTKLIREAISQNANELAYACLRETNKQIDPSLEEELRQIESIVIEARFKDLETYLKDKNWARADEETYRIMITAVGKEEGQFFTLEEFESFPRDELGIIDEIWLDNSEGQYGFSIQRKIYASVDKNLDLTKRLEEFGKLLGWRVNGKWVDCVYDGSGPPGHLPRYYFIEGLVKSFALLEEYEAGWWSIEDDRRFT